MQKYTPILHSIAICASLASSWAMADHLSGSIDLGRNSAILTEGATSLPVGSWYGSFSSEIVKNRSFSDDKLIGLRAFDIVNHGAAEDDLHSIEKVSSTSLTLAYGYSENLTLGLHLPYIERENIREPEEGHSHDGAPIVIHDVIEHGDSSGIGDVTLMGLYRFHNTSTTQIALLFGIKLPTGKDDQDGFENKVFVRRINTGVSPEHGHGDSSGHAHNGDRLETHQQPGSGSYDPMLGFAYSRELGPVDLNSSLLYSFANKGSQSTNLGDSLKYNLGLTYSLYNYLDFVLELNGEWRDSEVRGKSVIGNSGGSHLYLSPGIRFHPAGDWTASISFGIPLHEDIHGFQSEPESRLAGNLGFNF
jgi:hypothetical protein